MPGNLWSADIHVHPSGSFLLASNRRLNIVTVLALASDGSVDASAPPAFTALDGQKPRGLALSPDGAMLVVAHQANNSFSVYDVDGGSGRLTVWGPPQPLAQSPVCVRFV